MNAGTVEGLPVRGWTSGSGKSLQARLAFFADHQPQARFDDSLLLVPADLSQPPVVVRLANLGDEDRNYVERVRSARGYRSGYRDFINKPLTYADGEPIPGEFHYYSDRIRAVGFRYKKERFTYHIDLDSLSADSLARLSNAYHILPPLETPLAARVPLNLGAGDKGRFELKNVPLVKQERNYCVPASAEMVAKFHGLRFNQRQLAHLSSDASREHRGTWSGDMANAMEALGFFSQTRVWADLDTDKDFKRFEDEMLPFIRASLLQNGPLYVSFKPGVYGSMSHGCVIVGYNDHGKGEIYVHNPAGGRETYRFRDFSRSAYEVVRFYWPPAASGDAAALEKSVVEAFHRMPVDLTDAMNLLRTAGLKPALRLHGRRDRRDDRFEIERWALAQGFRVVQATLAHHSLCLIPATREDRIVGWYLLRREGEDPKLLVRPRGPQGWRDASRPPLQSFFKTWATQVNVPGQLAWDMPVIELD